jgi:hypothetical protein
LILASNLLKRHRGMFLSRHHLVSAGASALTRAGVEHLQFFSQLFDGLMSAFICRSFASIFSGSNEL